jgi:hypothetical protein
MPVTSGDSDPSSVRWQGRLSLVSVLAGAGTARSSSEPPTLGGLLCTLFIIYTLASRPQLEEQSHCGLCVGYSSLLWSLVGLLVFWKVLPSSVLLPTDMLPVA